MFRNILLIVLLVAQVSFGVTANKVWRIPSSGSPLGAWGPVNLADGTNAVTGLLGLSNQTQLTSNVSPSDSGNFFSCGVGGSYNNVTNASATLTTIGRPVLVGVQSTANSVSGAGTMRICQNPYAGGYIEVTARIYRDSSVVVGAGDCAIQPASGSGTWCLSCPVGIIAYDVPSSGSHTYQLQASMSSGSGISCGIYNVKVFAVEL